MKIKYMNYKIKQKCIVDMNHNILMIYMNYKNN